VHARVCAPQSWGTNAGVPRDLFGFAQDDVAKKLVKLKNE